MTNLQAAIGCAQLEQIHEIQKRNNQIESNYIEHLNDLNLFNWQQRFMDREKVVWLMSCTSSKRDQIMKALADNQVDVRPFFYCLSDMPIYKEYANHPTPIAHKVSASGLNLPTVEQIDFNRIRKILEEV